MFATPKLETSISTGVRPLTLRNRVASPINGVASLDSPAAARALYVKERQKWMRARKAESDYAAQLRQVARQVGVLVKGFAPSGTLEQFAVLRDALLKYADLLYPWAKSVAQRMLEEVSRKDESAWKEHGQKIGRSLWNEITLAPTGAVMRQRMDEQVDLITSLPREAAERVHKLSIRAVSTSMRAEEIQADILRTGEVTKSRAETIARTEVSRASTELLMARAKFVGSTHYEWLTARDADVRPLHRRLDGKIFAWDDPPVTGEGGERSLPGGIYNCRCVALPIIPDKV